ncbi:MAG: hypothetical protein KDI90_04765 [Alphaproteobacteria bacterium]|nr:hypothetical protein [Alphaproteobacteria bacterium]MCB9974359.1 hypothetical protein [Rhodospirillales bacterium]
MSKSDGKVRKKEKARITVSNAIRALGKRLPIGDQGHGLGMVWADA